MSSIRTDLICDLQKEFPTLISTQLIREQNENRMEQPFPPTGMGMHTIEQVLVRTIFHEGMHLGAILAIKRQLRKLSR